MANFKATLAAEAINGSVGDLDTANYLANQIGGVTVDVLNGGSRNTAEGDTYANIDRFFLTNLAGEVDRFIGSTADEIVHGFGGSNVLEGGGGDDALYAISAFNVTVAEDGRNVFNGGTGTDTMIGGEGDDRFDIAAGDATADELYRGN
ncbi:MAG: hypothetical protein P1U75_00455, partial [Antarcticimicrobium sp.]|nr:hypothetical protein [Antarcticimicrobium sp.]